MTETIFALATAPGRAAVAVIRISGSETYAALKAMGVHGLKPRQASLRTLKSQEGQRLDRALVLWFPAPASYTGEDSAEFHLHGGVAVVDSVTTTLLAAGLRLAFPGEFTRRAFENGKLDLGQAEAVADLVDAESAAQARQAMAQLDGALGRRYRTWREALIFISVQLEAALDFPDEEIPAEVESRSRRPLEDLVADLAGALAEGVRGRRVRDGYKVAVIGATNAGKSSLFNSLVERDAAIVTPIPGATRDVIEAQMALRGYRLILADMAGFRDTSDEVEAEGVRRAGAWAAAADLRLWVIDRAGEGPQWRMAAEFVAPGDLCVVNKMDLDPSAEGRRAQQAAVDRGLELLFISLADGRAEPVRDWLCDRVIRDLSGADFPATTRARHADLLRRAKDHLERALASLGEPELASEDVRMAVRSLALVTGSIGVEDILGEVFANFCIGK